MFAVLWLCCVCLADSGFDVAVGFNAELLVFRMAAYVGCFLLLALCLFEIAGLRLLRLFISLEFVLVILAGVCCVA